MIKKVIVFFLFFICNSFSQQSQEEITVSDSLAASDSINVSELVAMQIEAARQKELTEEEISETVPVAEEKEIVQGPVIKEKESFLSGFNFLSNRYLVLAVAAVVLMAFVFIRRKSIEKKKISMRKLKKNIQIIREERALKVSNPKLNELRTELRKNPSSLITDETEITKTAKELNIAKGEILLAARIKSFELRMER